jgi:hypothetical protein
LDTRLVNAIAPKLDYLGTRPARKRVQRICGEIRELTGRGTTSLDPVTIVTKLNYTMCGWANYFCLGPVSTTYRAVDSLWIARSPPTKSELLRRRSGDGRMITAELATTRNPITVPNRSLSPRTVGAGWFRVCRYVSNSFQVFVQTDAIRESARDSANHSQESLVPRSCRPSQHLLLQPNRHSAARRRFGRG